MTKKTSIKTSLKGFKEKKKLTSNSKFKPQTWLKLSEAYQEILGVPGIPLGQITLFRGHSDTGKTTGLIEAAIAAQKSNILPVFIITEMKWSWEHAEQMGFELEYDEEGTPDGFFLYIDREHLDSIENVAEFINDLLLEQAQGNLPYDLLFLWDSIGSIPCQMSIEKKKNNNEWNAGAMSTQFGGNINQNIILSRKASRQYTNTFLCINKVWTKKAEVPMGQPKLMNKGGMTMWFDCALQITYGNVSNSGVSKIKATHEGKSIEWGKKVNIQCDKNHINGITRKGKIVTTPHGFITEKDEAKYKKDHRDEWASILGTENFETVEEISDEPVEYA